MYWSPISFAPQVHFFYKKVEQKSAKKISPSSHFTRRPPSSEEGEAP